MALRRTKDKVASLRRVPTQARSKKRFESILDAAGEVFAEVGFEGAAMEAVAARAETSIGSVYQFFPNKLALFQAVAERCLARSREVFDAVMTPEAMDRPWPELLDAAIDGFAVFQADPGFRAIWMNMQLWGVYAKADAEMQREYIARTEAMIARNSPHIRPTERRLVATMTVQVISALMFFASREEPELSRLMIAETKVLIRRYLEPYASAPRRRGVSGARS